MPPSAVAIQRRGLLYNNFLVLSILFLKFFHILRLFLPQYVKKRVIKPFYSLFEAVSSILFSVSSFFYVPYADCHPEAKGGFTDEKERIKLSVKWKEGVGENISEEKRRAIEGCVSEDPRPSYQEDENRIYSMRFSEFDVHFKVKGTFAEIILINIVK